MIRESIAQSVATGAVFAVVLLGALDGRAAETEAGAKDRASLRAAITDLARTFGQRYPNGEQYLQRLDALPAGDQAGLAKLRTEALTANPLVSGRPLVFVTRSQYRSHYHAIDTLFLTDEFNWDRKKPHADLFGPGGALKTIDLKTGKLATLVQAPKGVIRDPDVSYDGKRILFSMRKTRDTDYHIYEINADGTGLRQLTRLPGAADVDPIYLPDGTIVISSTREPK